MLRASSGPAASALSLPGALTPADHRESKHFIVTAELQVLSQGTLDSKTAEHCY